MDIYPGKEGTVSISVERYKELEEKEQALENNKILFCTLYSYGKGITYYGKDDAIKEVIDASNELLRDMNDRFDKERIQRLEYLTKMKDTKQHKPSLLDRLRWEFKNTPLANV